MVKTSPTYGELFLEPFHRAMTRRLGILLSQGEHSVHFARIELPNDGLLVRRRFNAVKDFIRFFGGCIDDHLWISIQRMQKMGQHHARDA